MGVDISGLFKAAGRDFPGGGGAVVQAQFAAVGVEVPGIDPAAAAQAAQVEIGRPRTQPSRLRRRAPVLVRPTQRNGILQGLLHVLAEQVQQPLNLVLPLLLQVLNVATQPDFQPLKQAGPGRRNGPVGGRATSIFVRKAAPKPYYYQRQGHDKATKTILPQLRENAGQQGKRHDHQQHDAQSAHDAPRRQARQPTHQGQHCFQQAAAQVVEGFPHGTRLVFGQAWQLCQRHGAHVLLKRLHNLGHRRRQHPHLLQPRLGGDARPGAAPIGGARRVAIEQRGQV